MLIQDCHPRNSDKPIGPLDGATTAAETNAPTDMAVGVTVARPAPLPGVEGWGVDISPQLGAAAKILAFRRYRVFPAARRLVLEDREVELGGRAFDLLVTLLKARGRVVSKAEIVSEVWPSTTVDECNLRFQTATLRKALGDDRDVIKTIPGRGYLIIEEGEDSADPLAGYVGVEAALPGEWDSSSRNDATKAEKPRAPRLVELEAENIRLRLAIASLTVSRLVMVPQLQTATAG